ncbi:MAG: DUF4375 domain-containing protein [Clostridia bacterium]|nr:DUF4375 domain-containing protein [Oscillospiraceae bacterium]MBO5358223.1 DUF4375 domain-containing protein [Clostridia bacterium]
MGLLGVLFCINDIRKAAKFKRMGKDALLTFDDEKFYEAVDCLCEAAVYDIADEGVAKIHKLVYSLYKFEAEVNNGGLCQFFVNSSSECAPYISEALNEVGAINLKELFDNFIKENNIDVNDLSSFKITSIDEYEAQTKRFDFESFDNKFYEDIDLHQLIIKYSKINIDLILKY